ncbi:actin cross-linking domain-containing toxin [Streptomyces sp. NPDC002845]
MATSDEWSRVGHSGNPVTGNPGVVDGIAKELRELSDLAGRVSRGLDSLLAKAEDGGFEGQTADALRKYVKNELKTFMANVNRSFDMAATATARYAWALGEAQDGAENAADTVAALERIGGEPLAADDPELTRARGDVDAEVGSARAEAKILEDTLYEAARLVSRPIKKVKKSFWKRFVSTFFKVLEIVTLVLTLLAIVFTGPLGLVAFGLGVVLFIKALVDYASGNGNALSLGLAFLGILFPSTKGLTTVGGLARLLTSGGKALRGAMGASGRLLLRSGGRLLSSPGRLLSVTGQGLVRFAGGFGSRTVSGLSSLPRVISKAPGMVASTLRYMGGFVRSSWQQGRSALIRDFYQSTAFVGGNMALRVGVFTIMSMGRLTVSALLPMRYSEIARFGYRGAFRMGFLERGLHWGSRGSTVTRAGTLGGDLAGLTGKGRNPSGNLRPVGDRDADKFAVPGTPEFNNTLDELADITVTPVTAPGTRGFSSLTGARPIQFSGRLDDLGSRLTNLDPLDTVGLPVGTAPGGQRLSVLNTVNGRLGDELMSSRLRTTLTTFDPFNQFDEFGAPIAPGAPVTLPPRNAVDQLRDLDTLTGLERTPTGLLKPLDDLTDLADLSIDGRLGGLNEFQLRQVLDGEIDLVNVTPDGVVLRVGKTDPVDVRVQMKDGVRVDVLGPADTRVPTLSSTTGPGRLEDLGIRLDDLTRLIPDTTDGSRTARELIGLGPGRTDLVAAPVTTNPSFTPLTLRDIITGGATGKLATDRFQAWIRTQSAQFQLDTAGRRLTEVTELTDVPPLGRAKAELDLSAAQLDFNRARIEFDRLGMNLDTVRRDITVMTARVDGPAATLPTGELRLLDDLGRPTGQWITMEPGQNINWVLRTDSGVVPDVKVEMVDGVFTVTAPDGVVARFGADGRPALGDGLLRLNRFDAPAPRIDTVRLDPQQFTGVPSLRTEWERTPLEGGGFAFADPAGDVRLVFSADDVLQFRDIRTPLGDSFLRFDANPAPGTMPRVVGMDGLPLSGRVVVVEPVTGALGVVTGARIQTPDGSWVGRFDLDGTRLSEDVALSGLTDGPPAGARLTTTFTQLPGGGVLPSFRLTVPGLGDGAFSVGRLEGSLAQRLPGGFTVTDTATGARFVFDRGGRFVELPVDGTPPIRLDTSGGTPPETTVGPPTNLDALGGPLSERLPLTAVPGNTVLDDAATDLTGLGSAGERVTVEGLTVPAPPRVAPPPAPAPPPVPAPPRVAPPPVPAAPQLHVPDVPPVPRPARAVAPGFETSFPAPSIGTESELSGFVVALPESADRTFAFVSKVGTDEPLVLVTKDMSKGGYQNPAQLTMAQRGNWKTHTVELVTYPSRLGDEVAIGTRNDATQFLLDVFKDRLGVHNHKPLESMISPDGRFALRVTNDRHVIAAGTGLQLDELSSVSMPPTGQQATIGIRAVDFGSSVTNELKVLADNAHWYKPAFRNDDALRTALSRETLDAPVRVENAYTYVKSVIDFTSDLVNRHGIAIEDWAGAAPYRGLTDPVVKNEWGVLPRTRPSLVLDSLSPGDRAMTLKLLRETPAIGDESIWKAVKQYILNGNEVAGRGINNATIGGERALLFEFRSVPDQLKGVVPTEKAPVVVVSDPLAELGSNRAAAVQKINKFVSGPENKDAFADWYRAEFPKDPNAARIYQNRDADWILRTAAARHKSEWISLHHPRTWQEITARPVFVEPPASAVSSAPPVTPHVGAGPLPDELGRPVSLVGGPDVPVAPLQRITQAPMVDLSGATALRQLLDSPVSPASPVSAVREVPLSGLDELTGLRLRVTEIPATDAAPASVRVEVLDFTAPGGPVRLPDAPVTVREGGGFTATGPQGGVRWQFDALGNLEYRELPLSGTDFALRFTDDALSPMPQVVGRDGVPLRGASVTPVRDATGALSELTVRVPMPGTDGLTGVWRFEPGGLLRQQELPLTLPGLDGPSGLGVKVTITPGAGGTTTKVVELTGPSHLTGSFRLTSVDSSLAGRLPNGFTLSTATGSRFHFDAGIRLAVRDLPAPDGSGFLRFTEGAAPGTPPVRLDELGSLPDVGPADARARFDELWTRLGAEGEPLSPAELDRLMGPDSPRTDSLSELSDMSSDFDLADLQARLDRLRRMDDEPLSALDGSLSRADEPTGLTGPGPDGPPLHLDELNPLPLSGVDELADFDVRLTRLPAADAAPQGSYRLELVDRTPGGAGQVRASDFTVELLGDSGRFAVIDPTGTTRFTFGPEGRFLGRETALVAEGLPAGLRLRVTIGPGADGTGRTVDLLGPAGAARSITVTPTGGTLAARLPGGVTLTDTVTGSRFHFDHTGRLAFRDLPAEDGSGFLRFTEGAAPDTPPIRLDDLDDLDDGIRAGERLTSGPEDGVLGSIDLARVFDRTLDEASGLRTLPEGTPADLSDIGRAMDFLEPDSHVVQSLDVPAVHRLADDAAADLNRFGLRPEHLNDQLRNLTGETRLALRQQAVTTLGDYLNLPLATRLDDLQSVGQGGAGRVLGDFTVTPTPHGGPGGSRYTVVHNPSDVTLGFGPNRELLYQEVFLRGGPSDLDGLKLGMTGRAVDGGPWTPSSLDFVGGTRTFTVTDLAPTAPHELRGGFTVTDAAGTTSRHYGPEGVQVLRDVQLPGDRGVLRFDAGVPDGVPQVLDSAGHPLPGLRTEFLDDGRIALIPTGKGAQPLERTVFDPSGTLLEETVAIRGKGGVPTGEYWKIDHAAGTAVRTDVSGTPLTGRFDTAAVEKSPTGQFRLTGAQPGKVTLFERETFRNGNVLHLSRDRFGHARWTEFDSPGNTFRHGERIADPDQRTFHDLPTGSWRRPINNSGDVRTYTKGIDGGLVRAEKGADGHWTWQRFDKVGAESLSGTRHWSWDHVGFRDTFLDPATGVETVAQRRGRTWPFGGEHGSRMYQEHAVVPGHAPAGGRTDAGTYTGYGAFNAQIESLETLADGGSLLVKRYADMRPPAFLWKSAAGRSPFDGFFRDLFAGDSLHRVSHWTQTAADGTQVTGVRLNPTGSNWVDIDQYGRFVRETRKLDNGNVIEVGRSLEDPKQWAPLPEYREGGSYELSWRDTTSGTTGTRHVDGTGQWKDVFTDELGVDRVRLRSEGRGTREYLFEAPSTADLAVRDNAGVWVDRNSLQHITGRRDLIGGQVVESSGSPYRTSWTWRAFSTEDPATVVAEGVRKQNRGSFYSKTWDDSFVDLDGLGNPVRERNATDVAGSWVDAVKQPDGGWKWTKTAADGTVHSEGTRVYDDFAGGRWRDLVDGQTVRQRGGGRVREFDYEIVTPERAPALTTTGSLRDLLAQAARQFEPPTTVRVNPEVWKEYDLGKVFRERVAVDGTPGRYREVDKQWGQWREFQDGHLVEQRTFTGRVWKTDAFGRWSTSGPAMLPEYLAGALPRMGDEVGLAGDRGWKLIGRETDFRGAEIEALGLLREVQDPWHGVFQGVREGVSAEMPVWQRELRAALTTFSTGFITDVTSSLAVTAATNDGKVKLEDFYKALLTGTISGTFNGGLNVLYNRTPLGFLKNSMGARDWGAHPKVSMNSNTDDWATDWAAQEKPTRWRNATYANTVGIGTSALNGFVANAISAAVFGVNGHETKGADALLAGLWGAGSYAFSGVTTGLARNAFHLTTGARVFHKGGLGELGMTWTESFLARYTNYWIAQAGGNDLSTPNRSFPPPPTTESGTGQQPASDPAASSLSSLTDGSEFP